MMVNDEVERTWNKEVMDSFKLVWRHLRGGTEENIDGDLTEIRIWHHRIQVKSITGWANSLAHSVLE
jgi:hypothetical protein